MRNESNFLEFTKSLMKKLKYNGPKIEPCGIPFLIYNNSDVIFSYCTLKTINHIALDKCKWDSCKTVIF